MDRLWSPWRYQYVSHAQPAVECIFCAKPTADDSAGLILHRGRRCYALLNLYPYNTGHLMIAPYDHVATLADCPAETAAELMELTRHAEGLLRRAYNPHGVNIGMNVGECAGAGVAGHIHMHVLPRWPGDVNFMTTVGETRVLPEDLATTWTKLRTAW
jgi:ATP adenylyltransferase